MKKLLSTISLITILSAPSYGTKETINFEDTFCQSKINRAPKIAEQNALKQAEINLKNNVKELNQLFENKTITSALLIYEKDSREIKKQLLKKIDDKIAELFGGGNYGNYGKYQIILWDNLLDTRWDRLSIHASGIIRFAEETILDALKKYIQMKTANTIKGTSLHEFMWHKECYAEDQQTPTVGYLNYLSTYILGKNEKLQTVHHINMQCETILVYWTATKYNETFKITNVNKIEVLKTYLGPSVQILSEQNDQCPPKEENRMEYTQIPLEQNDQCPAKEENRREIALEKKLEELKS